jgi:lysozyme
MSMRTLLKHEVAHMATANKGGVEAHHLLPISKAGLDLIKHFEGYHVEQDDGSCTAYLDVAGVPTLGYGSIHGVKLGMRWTREQAEEALMSEVQGCASTVQRLVTVPLNQQQQDALVSFVYNLGGGAFQRSTLLKKLNRGDYAGAEAEFGKWVYASKGAGGPKVKYNGLIRRRKAEASMFADNDVIVVPVEMPSKAPMPQAPATRPIKVPWYSAPLALLTSVGAWFADKLDGVTALIKGAGNQFLDFSPAVSLVQASGISLAPVMASLAALSVFIAAKTMLSDTETVE